MKKNETGERRNERRSSMINDLVTFVKKSCEEKMKQTSTIFLVFWMSNAGFWEIDDKKICVQTSFSRIPLRISREEKMKQKKYCGQVQYSLKKWNDQEYHSELAIKRKTKSKLRKKALRQNCATKDDGWWSLNVFGYDAEKRSTNCSDAETTV